LEEGGVLLKVENPPVEEGDESNYRRLKKVKVEVSNNQSSGEEFNLSGISFINYYMIIKITREEEDRRKLKRSLKKRKYLMNNEKQSLNIIITNILNNHIVKTNIPISDVAATLF
jgi:hypothetical protein